MVDIGPPVCVRLKQKHIRVFGLGVIGVLPVPTAISVVAGVLAKIDESTILVTLVTTRFVKVRCADFISRCRSLLILVLQ